MWSPAGRPGGVGECPLPPAFGAVPQRHRAGAPLPLPRAHGLARSGPRANYRRRERAGVRGRGRGEPALSGESWREGAEPTPSGEGGLGRPRRNGRVIAAREAAKPPPPRPPTGGTPRGGGGGADRRAAAGSAGGAGRADAERGCAMIAERRPTLPSARAVAESTKTVTRRGDRCSGDARSWQWAS